MSHAKVSNDRRHDLFKNFYGGAKKVTKPGKGRMQNLHFNDTFEHGAKPYATSSAKAKAKKQMQQPLLESQACSADPKLKNRSSKSAAIPDPVIFTSEKARPGANPGTLRVSIPNPSKVPQASPFAALSRNGGKYSLPRPATTSGPGRKEAGNTANTLSGIAHDPYVRLPPFLTYPA